MAAATYSVPLAGQNRRLYKKTAWAHMEMARKSLVLGMLFATVSSAQAARALPFSGVVPKPNAPSATVLHPGLDDVPQGGLAFFDEPAQGIGAKICHLDHAGQATIDK